LLKAREAVGQQIADLDRKAVRMARNDAQVRRFMTAPGVGSITALCFLATIDDPTRFRVGFKISDSKYRSIDAETGRYRRPCALGKRSPLRLSNPVLDNDVLRNDTCNQLK